MVSAAGSRRAVRVLHRARGPARRAAQRPRPALHRSVHPVGPAGLRPQQPVPQSGGGHGAGRSSRPVLPRGRGQVLRLRARVHRPPGHRGRPGGLQPPPAPGAVHQCRDPAGGPPDPAGALAVRRSDPQEGPDHQDRADDRQPRLPLHLQLLHRFDGRLSAPELPDAPGRSEVRAHQVQEPDHRLARPEFRGALRRLHGGHRGLGASGEDAPYRREQPLPAGGTAPQATPGKRLPGHPARHRVVVRHGEQVQDPADRAGQGHAGIGAREPDSPLHPLHPDQLRARPGWGHRQPSRSS